MPIFAQASEWASAGTLVANLGFSALVGWYLLTKAIPKLQEESGRFHAAQRAEFLDALERHRIHSDSRYDKVQSEHQAVVKVLTEHYERQAVRHDKAVEVDLTLFTKALQEHTIALERVREVIHILIVRVPGLSSDGDRLKAT